MSRVVISQSDLFRLASLSIIYLLFSQNFESQKPIELVHIGGIFPDILLATYDYYYYVFMFVITHNLWHIRLRLFVLAMGTLSCCTAEETVAHPTVYII